MCEVCLGIVDEKITGGDHVRGVCCPPYVFTITSGYTNDVVPTCPQLFCEFLSNAVLVSSNCNFHG